MPNPLGFALTPVQGNGILNGQQMAKAYIREIAHDRPCTVIYTNCPGWIDDRYVVMEWNGYTHCCMSLSELRNAWKESEEGNLE